MSITGRRKTGLGDSILRGLAAVGTAMSDGPKLERIRQIDADLDNLQHEKDTLIAGLIEPGDLRVSEGYDPHRAVVIRNVRPGEPRLVECEGRSTMSVFHDAHPACPYIEQRHNAHEFTLRD